MLVVRDGAPWLAETLEALGPPATACPTGWSWSTPAPPTPAPTSCRLRAAEPRRRPGHRPAGRPRPPRSAAAWPWPWPGSTQDGAAATPCDWLWLLHDDGAPDELTLHRLLDAARRSPSVAIAGPKHTTWSDEGRLLEVGQPVTRTGRRAGGPAPGEPDQGQHDDRSDVLGVSSSGMLVRRDVFAALGGFEPAFAPYAEDVDLCWRAHLAGHRVVVVPHARVREAAASRTGEHAPERPTRRPHAAAERRQYRAGRAHPEPARRGAAAGRCGSCCPRSPPACCCSCSSSRVAPGPSWPTSQALLPALADGRRPLARPRPADRCAAATCTPCSCRRASRPAPPSTCSTTPWRSDQPARTGPRCRPTAQPETGPVRRGAEELTALPTTWPARAARHPGLLAVLATLVVARHLPGAACSARAR